MAQMQVVEQVVVRADPALVWGLISEPTNYARWSPEAVAITRRRGQGSWQVGDTFVGSNKVRLPWATICTVVERREAERFSFEVDLGPVPIARWSYELQGHAEGVVVSEHWLDRRTGPLGTPVRLVGPLVGRGWDAAAWNRRSMQATLAALREQAEGLAGPG